MQVGILDFMLSRKTFIMFTITTDVCLPVQGGTTAFASKKNKYIKCWTDLPLIISLTTYKLKLLPESSASKCS